MRACGQVQLTLWLGTVIVQALVECGAQILARIHEAFIDLEVGVVLSHRILTEITLALLIGLSADLLESLDSFEQRRRVLVGTFQRP